MPASSARRSEKAKSYQVPSSRTTTDSRPRAARTLSSTLVELRRADDTPAHLQVQDQVLLRRPLPNVEGQDEDEVAGVVGAVRTFSPFHTPELSEPLPTLNIAVVGHSNVGKSTFMQRALELPALPTSQAAERKLPIDGSDYIVRLLELPIEELDIDDDDTINWPDTIEDKMMPRVDGAIALYDVQDKESIEGLPQVLNAIANAAVPTLLLSCKCDTPPSEREIDPFQVELNARRAISSITTFQISRDPESHRRGISVLLNSIVGGIAENRRRSLSANRRRAQTSTLGRSVSPRQLGHSRASSELSSTLYKDQRHSRHDSSIVGYTSSDRLRVPRDDDQMQSTFLHEASASEASLTSSRSSTSADAYQALAGASQSSIASENGATFDELVTRLLAQPTSKSDIKFSAIFLAMYRKFAAPGKLLEAIVQRFDALERNGSAQMMKSVTQLRHVAILQSWVSTYPGDFAYPKTRQRLRTFVSKLAATRIFAAAARELSVDMEAIREDDDTNWAFSDKDRDASGDTSRSSLSSTASTLIDDPAFTFEQELSGSTINDDVVFEALPKFANQMMVYVEQAQKQAQTLLPVPRSALTKSHWRALMELPDELIAKELTRMDWIMFSAIRPRDLVRHVALSKEQKEACKDLAHVNRMIDHFNQLASWVANYVLCRDKPKHRALMLEKFMRIARKLRELNNYNALGAVIAGVKSTSVHRLGATRELIPQTTGKDWLKLEILMAPSRSHFAYRLAWENSSTERIPYLPLHRRDLASAEEGNKTFIGHESEGRINWKKFEIMGEVIVGLQRAQGMPYKNIAGTKGNEHVKELVLGIKLMKDEDELYERSVQCEPPASAAIGPSAKFKEFFKR